MTSSAWSTILKKCGMHSCHVSEQLQAPVMGLNLSFYITASFLCTKLVSWGRAMEQRWNISVISLPWLSPWQKLPVLTCSCQHHRNATAVHRSISKMLLGNDSSTKNLSIEVRSAVCKGIIVDCCCWRSFAWEVMLLCWLSSNFRADEVKCLSAGEGYLLLLLFIDSTFF